ncbi:MAG: ABC transporter permease [Bacillota bacterium]
MSLKILIGAVELGLIFGVMALGVFITFRVLDFPDLTVDGSITLGAATAAILISKGYSPWLGFALAPFVGALAGVVTGILHARFQIAPLLAGILTMTGLYSVNLRIMGRANLPLLGTDTLADSMSFLGVPLQYRWVIFGSLLIVIVVYLLYWLFQTELGLALRATGDNETMIKSQGVNVAGMKVFGLALGNGLVALSGAVVAQLQGFADMGMGIGMIISGLAAVIIGEMLVGTSTILRALVAVVCGSLAYRIIISLVLRMGLQTTDLKLVTAILVVVALTLPKFGFKKRLLNLGRWSNAAVKENN